MKNKLVMLKQFIAPKQCSYFQNKNIIYLLQAKFLIGASKQAIGKLTYMTHKE